MRKMWSEKWEFENEWSREEKKGEQGLSNQGHEANKIFPNVY